MSVTSPMEPLARVRSKQMLELLTAGKRIDGRDLLNYREIKLERDVIEKAEGSASVTLGESKVLVGVKIETGPPYADTPDKGVFTVNSEFVPLASETFEPGPPDENSIELARVIDRGIRESKTVEVEKLVLVPGKLVYIVFVDIYILNYTGNLLDAAEYASIAALLNAKLPIYEVSESGEAKATGKYGVLPVRDIPISTTWVKIDDKLLVDPNLEEETISSAKMTVTFNKNGDLCAIQKSGTGTFKLEEIFEIYKTSRDMTAKIRARLFQE